MRRDSVPLSIKVKLEYKIVDTEPDIVNVAEELEPEPPELEEPLEPLPEPPLAPLELEDFEVVVLSPPPLPTHATRPKDIIKISIWLPGFIRGFIGRKSPKIEENLDVCRN